MKKQKREAITGFRLSFCRTMTVGQDFASIFKSPDDLKSISSYSVNIWMIENYLKLLGLLIILTGIMVLNNAKSFKYLHQTR